MFDVYSNCRADARSVAFSHPETLTTWPDMVRQNRDIDIDIRLYEVFCKSSLSVFAANSSVRFQHWLGNIWHRPARRVHRPYLPLKHRSPFHR
jgi:hypothetical protein